MTFRKNLRILAIGLGASLVAAQAHSIPIAKTDVTIENPAGVFVSSSAAALGKGSIKKTNVNALTGLFAGDSWSLLDQTNKRSTKFKSMNFLLTADVRKDSGQWGLQWAGTNFPDYMDYVLVLKSGRQWGAYLLDGSKLPDSKKLRGTFSMPWLTTSGRGTKLRFASIYGRVGKAPLSPLVTGGGGSGGGSGGSGSDNGGGSGGGDNGGSGSDNGGGSGGGDNGGGGSDNGGGSGGGDNGGGGSDNGGGSGGGSGGGDSGGGSGGGSGGSGGSGGETIVPIGGPGGEDSPGDREVNAVSSPGTFALLAMGLGLVLTHLRRKTQGQRISRLL